MCAEPTTDNMSYIPPWVTGASSGHYPAHMLPPQHTLPAHTQHPATPSSTHHQQHPAPVSSQHPPSSSHSPHPPVTESHVSHVYQSLSSPKALLVSSPSLPPINGTKNGGGPEQNNHHHLSQPVPSPSAQSSPATIVSIANSIAQHHQQQQQQQQPPPPPPPPSTTPNRPPPTSTPSHPGNNNLDSPYEPQGFHRNDVGSPPPKLISSDLRHDLASQLHSLPELALGIPGTSASAEMKAHRKYVRRSEHVICKMILF